MKLLEDWLKRSHNRDFIAKDPMQFADRFRDDWHRCELTAFFSALLSYGRRELIVQSLENVLDRMGGDPCDYLQRYSKQKAQRDFKGYVYRFNRSGDLVWLFGRLQQIYNDYGSLEAVFLKSSPSDAPLSERLQAFTDTLIGPDKLLREKHYGLRYLLADAKGGGACKRLHLFLRWVVRNDEALSKPVDFGLWKKALRPADLIMPLDTHVGTLSRELGLTRLASNDWKTAEEITAAFRRLNPEDPTIYDFALMGWGTARHRGEIVEPKASKLVSRV